MPPKPSSPPVRAKIFLRLSTTSPLRNPCWFISPMKKAGSSTARIPITPTSAGWKSPAVPRTGKNLTERSPRPVLKLPRTAACRTITAIFLQGSQPPDPAQLNIPMEIPLFTAPASPSTKMFSILMMTGMKSSMRSFIQPERWVLSVQQLPSSGHSCFGSPVFRWCWPF